MRMGVFFIDRSLHVIYAELPLIYVRDHYVILGTYKQGGSSDTVLFPGS
jgi:hypothetical protein